ncbi:MAG: DNA repair protein RadC [Defluviitaleaceae bacterium]|nr:DNA repair protein RadC [Defluviitaleaceae bacterium]
MSVGKKTAPEQKDAEIKNIHEGRRERIRQRYIENGLENFAEHEVLEFLLFYCYPQRDTNAIAHKMMDEFGSLHNLMEAGIKTVMQKCGVSENVAVLVSLVPKLANRYFRSKWDRKVVFESGETAGEYAAALYVGMTNEAFHVICLDKQKRLNYVACISEGTIDESAAYPREIVNAVMTHQAAAVILAHNHPGGTARPSQQDNAATARIVEGLKFINVAVADHIIVAGGQYFSYASRGLYVEGY